jgi:hypothetical protein
MAKKICFTLSVILVLFAVESCKKKAQSIDSVFPQSESLKFTPLELGDFFFKPETLEVFDSLLLVCDPVESHHYSIVNLNTRKVILEGGQRGNGPDDLVYGSIIDKIDDDLFQVIDATNRKTLIYSISNIINTSKFIPESKIFYSNLDSEIRDGTMVMFSLNDSISIGLGIYKKGKYVIYKRDGTFEYLLNYPESTDNIVNPYLIHQGLLHFNKDRKIFLYHSPLGYYYELVSYTNNLFETIASEYIPHEYMAENGEFLVTEKTICGINTADFTTEEIFMLYSGRNMKDYPHTAFYCNRILVIDYKGDKKRIYYLDRDVSMMNVDEKHRKIYAIAQNPETFELEIGYFSY